MRLKQTVERMGAKDEERARWYYPEHPEHWKRDEEHLARATTPEPSATLCGKYLGDNDGTCPQLTCIRRRLHTGACDNVCGDVDATPEPSAATCTRCGCPKVDGRTNRVMCTDGAPCVYEVPPAAERDAELSALRRVAEAAREAHGTWCSRNPTGPATYRDMRHLEDALAALDAAKGGGR